MMSEEQRRQELKDRYGITFPDELFRFWEFVNAVNPSNPFGALDEALGVWLAGPFDVLAGKFDLAHPALDTRLHWRFWGDPPEFFTILNGDTDGLHWGYWFDDPDQSGSFCVASYYSKDAYEFSMDGASIFQAVRSHLEGCHASTLENMEDDQDSLEEYRKDLDVYAKIRQELPRCGVGERPEVGEEYLEAYESDSLSRLIVAETLDGMGLVVPPEAYRPLNPQNNALRFVDGEDVSSPVNEARQALNDGFPGAALQLGKALWAGDEMQQSYGYELMDAAYRALGRETLRQVMQVHRAHRNLKSVDILQQ